jgi:hypothetical protein
MRRHYRRSGGGAAKQRGAAVAPSAAAMGGQARIEVFGTWDFKWPLGTKIRIAFQQLPSQPSPEEGGISAADFGSAKALVRDRMAVWMAAMKGIELDVEFVEPDLEPPLGEEHSLTDQHRSPFDPVSPRKQPYDVLISLQDLPVTRVDPFQASDRLRIEIPFPDSALGAYARHADYGAPTVYLGRFRGWRENNPRADLSFYLKSAVGVHMTMHELGHVLGLPHMHQHPHLSDARDTHFQKVPDIQAVLARILGEPPSRTLIEDNIIAAWPGNLAFSDWLPVTTREREEYEQKGVLDSIMTHPYYRHLLQKASQAIVPEDALDLPDQPGRRDIEMLHRMYNPDFAVTHDAPLVEPRAGGGSGPSQANPKSQATRRM